MRYRDIKSSEGEEGIKLFRLKFKLESSNKCALNVLQTLFFLWLHKVCLDK